MKKLTAGVVLSGAVLLGTSMTTQQAIAADITLQFANWLPPFHHWTKTARRFADSIEKQSGGKRKKRSKWFGIIATRVDCYFFIYHSLYSLSKYIYIYCGSPHHCW